MSRVTKLPKGSPKYLYNPRNKRVMVATVAKLARVTRDGDPYFVPCNSVTGPTGPKVKAGTTKENKPEEIVPGADASEPTKDSGDLMNTVNESTDKDELVGIGAAIGVKLTRSMKVSTMQERLKAKIDELDQL